MAWMGTDCKSLSEDIAHFQWKIKWRLELLSVLGIMGEKARHHRSSTPIPPPPHPPPTPTPTPNLHVHSEYYSITFNCLPFQVLKTSSILIFHQLLLPTFIELEGEDLPCN